MKIIQNSNIQQAKVDRLITTKELAQLTGMSLSWLYEQKRQGNLPAAICLGRARRYRESDVLAWIQQHSAAKEA